LKKKYAAKKYHQKPIFAALCSELTFLQNSIATFENWTFFWTKINVHFLKVFQLIFFFFSA